MTQEPFTHAITVRKNDYSYSILYSTSQNKYFSIIESKNDIPQVLQNLQEDAHIPISIIPFLDSSAIDPSILTKFQEEDTGNSIEKPNSLVSLLDILCHSESDSSNENSNMRQFTPGEYAKAIYGISQAFFFAAEHDISISLSDIFFDNEKLPHVAFCTPIIQKSQNSDYDKFEHIYKPNEAKIAFAHILYLLAFLFFDDQNGKDESDDDFFFDENEEPNLLPDEFNNDENEEEENAEQDTLESNENDTPRNSNDIINESEDSPIQNENKAEPENNEEVKQNENEKNEETEKEKAESKKKVLFDLQKILRVFRATNHVISPPFELFPSFIDELVDRCMRPTVPFEWIINQISLNIEFIIDHGENIEKVIDDPTTQSQIRSFKQYRNKYQKAATTDGDEADDENENVDDDIPLRPPAAAPGTFRSFVIQEDLPYKMDPWIYCQTQSIIDLQAILMDTTEETLEENISIFLDSVYRNDMQLIDSFVHYIIIAVFHRPKCIKTITLFVKGIIDACTRKKIGFEEQSEIDDDGIEYANRLKEAILRMTPEKPASSGHYANACGPLNFLYECHKIGVFNDEEIFKLIRRLTTVKVENENELQVDPSQYKSQSFEVRRVGAHLAAYFAPLIEKFDPSFLSAIVSYVLTYRGDFPKVFATTFTVISEIIESEGGIYGNNEAWKRLDKMIYDEKGIREILQRDEIEKLREMTANPSFDINMRIQPSLFDSYFVAADKPTLLEYSGFHSALKCFRYLLLNGAETKLQDTLSHTVVHYAIDGGSIEIIRICEQEGLSFDGALEESVKMYQFDIFEWLQGTKYPVLPMNNMKFGSIPVNAARTNNIRMILFSLENGLDINASDQYDSFPLLLASLFGYNDVVRLLLTSPAIEVNKQDRQGNTSLIIAIDEGYIDTVRLLLSHKDIDISLGNDRGILFYFFLI